MIVMKFGGVSMQDAQAIDRATAIVPERLPERSATTSALANSLTPDNDPAPEARKSLAHPEASNRGPQHRAGFACWGGNAKPEGWVGHKMRSSPVGATHESSCKNLSAPPRLRGGFAAKTFLRASVSPWWVFSGVPS